MIVELISEFLREIALAAIYDATMMPIVNDSGPARFVVMDPVSRVMMCSFVGQGEHVRVCREWRLMVEPLASVSIRSLPALAAAWGTS